LPPLTPAESAVAGVLGLVPVAIDDIIDGTRLPTPEVQSALVTLELKQVARRLPGNRFVRAT
jgi:predicted Rossmann fold nucleotide-binding protein DprA/Smf involved in DNA uptake